MWVGLIALVTSGCTLGAGTPRTSVVDVAGEPRSQRWAAVVVERAAVREDTTHVSVWVGGDLGEPIARRARVAVPPHVRHAFAARLLGWAGGAPTLELAGHAQPETLASTRRARWLALPAGGRPTALAQLPAGLARADGASGLGGESRRAVFAQRDSIYVSGDAGRRLRLVAVLDRASGELRAAAELATGGTR